MSSYYLKKRKEIKFFLLVYQNFTWDFHNNVEIKEYKLIQKEFATLHFHLE